MIGRCGGANVTEEGVSAATIRTIDAEAAKHDESGNIVDIGSVAEAGQLGQAPAAARPDVPARPGSEVRDLVTVRMPADSAYLSVLRTATAGLAARLDFTLDEIEDMRIAVDEACAMLLSQAIPGSSLDCEFTLDHDSISVSVSVRCVAPRVPSSDTFAWTVLSALAGSVDAQVGPGEVLTIVLRKSRESSGSA
jgi:serine/threonine-protein kinase RsbW